MQSMFLEMRGKAGGAVTSFKILINVRRITEDGVVTVDRSGIRRIPIATKFDRRFSDN